MNRDNNTAEIIELGSVSVETRGIPGPKVEDTAGLPLAGLSDD